MLHSNTTPNGLAPGTQLQLLPTLSDGRLRCQALKLAPGLIERQQCPQEATHEIVDGRPIFCQNCSDIFGIDQPGQSQSSPTTPDLVDDDDSELPAREVITIQLNFSDIATRVTEDRVCGICMSKKLSILRLTNCGHEICEECLREKLLTEIGSRFDCAYCRMWMLHIPRNVLYSKK
ncbi:uncharacterized protein BDR25DRAFT_311408 [Lindgomyces ingoldianus]|uniref:Uncharacterized protein n=1 Tax=Lindgomyces ingoldianus TaxID=673940 RepID=A0ACB6R9A4_9PLEO|nr:uncharacterized protein BDR25DRAFT_311408 [Lindgomyces ingoldianus]KAF2475041.1 hypothetical protein BDR25DRAFT_311408 [Lindgomyces ingoldianus]